jgi:hypothetical protein
MKVFPITLTCPNCQTSSDAQNIYMSEDYRLFVEALCAKCNSELQGLFGFLELKAMLDFHTGNAPRC